MPTVQYRRRGNPNWGQAQFIPSGPALPTQFELQVHQLRLAPEMYVYSEELRGWCERNCNRCYIPEWLLAAWGIFVDANLFSSA
jgi:hypothetical protein